MFKLVKLAIVGVIITSVAGHMMASFHILEHPAYYWFIGALSVLPTLLFYEDV